jgi:hypothetical protein
MLYSFFEQQWERLRGVYSHAAMGDERKRIMWERFRFEQPLTFENAVNHVIAEMTSQQLPAVSKFAEACGFFRTKAGPSSVTIVEPQHSCEACRDFGYGWIGDTITKCVCPAGDKINPAEMFRQQTNYDRGRKLLPNRDKLPAFLSGEDGA